MMRPLLALVTASSLALSVGCGLIPMGTPKSQSFRKGSVTRTFDATVSKTVLTILELNWDEIPFQGDFDFPIKSAPVGETKFQTQPAPGTLSIDPEDIRFDFGGMTSKTKDGRVVQVFFTPLDHDRKTEVTVVIGRHGDPDLSNALLDRIADRLAHPIVRTPEEIARRKIVVPIVGADKVEK